MRVLGTQVRPQKKTKDYRTVMKPVLYRAVVKAVLEMLPVPPVVKITLHVDYEMAV